MGKKITVYLTEKEMEVLEAICHAILEADGLDGKICINYSQGLKRSIEEAYKALCAHVGLRMLNTPQGAVITKEIAEKVIHIHESELGKEDRFDVVKSKLDEEKDLEKEALEEKKAKARREADEFFKKTFSNTPLVKKRGEKK